LFNQTNIFVSIVFNENTESILNARTFNLLVTVNFLAYLLDTFITNKVFFGILLINLKNDNITFFLEK